MKHSLTRLLLQGFHMTAASYRITWLSCDFILQVDAKHGHEILAPFSIFVNVLLIYLFLGRPARLVQPSLLT